MVVDDLDGDGELEKEITDKLNVDDVENVNEDIDKERSFDGDGDAEIKEDNDEGSVDKQPNEVENEEAEKIEHFDDMIDDFNNDNDNKPKNEEIKDNDNNNDDAKSDDSETKQAKYIQQRMENLEIDNKLGKDEVKSEASSNHDSEEDEDVKPLRETRIQSIAPGSTRRGSQLEQLQYEKRQSEMEDIDKEKRPSNIEIERKMSAQSFGRRQSNFSNSSTQRMSQLISDEKLVEDNKDNDKNNQLKDEIEQNENKLKQIKEDIERREK